MSTSGLFGTPASQPAGGLLGTPTQSTQQMGSIFAGTPTTNQTSAASSNLFGGNPISQASSANGILGTKPISQPNSQSAGLFGGTPTNTANVPLTNKSVGAISTPQLTQQSGLFGGSFTSSPTTFSTSANFNDLLSRADSLKSKVIPADQQSSLLSKSTTGDHDLRSIFRASDEIWKRKQLRSDAQWKPKNALSDAPTKPTNIEQAITAIAPLDQSTSVALDKYVKRSTERARIEAERAFINQHILDQSHFVHDHAKHKFAGTKVTPSHTENMIIGTESQTNGLVMETFAAHVSKSLGQSCSVSIESAVCNALEELNEVDSNKLWQKVFAICERKQGAGDSGSVADFRNSDQWKSFVVEQAIILLQKTFKEHMETVIQNNLQEAQRGGVPGTVSLIDAYLNVRMDPKFDYEDTRYGKHPIWPFIFLCLRIGDYGLASKVASTSLQNVTHNSILVKILAAFNSNQLIDGDRRFQLNAEWKHVMSTSRDPYKRAVYAMILGHECPEVNNCIENWLWSRLMNCKLDPVNGLGHFYKLQTTICVDYGEKYFVSEANKPALYFTVLWLTGQIERAIDLLFRADQRHHAVHIAILAYQQKLLNVGKYSASPILLYDPKDPIYCQLNFSRLILLYVKDFELTNLDYTLSYCFFLRELEFENEGGLEGGNIFEACISRLCFMSEKVDKILGRMSDVGDRIPGLIDKFASAEVDIYKVIARVARDFDIFGDSITACRLYVLSGHPNEALQICSKQLAAYLSTINGGGAEKLKELDDTVMLGTWLEKRYQQRPDPGLRESHLAELSILLKLSAFYAAANSDPIEALAIMKSLNLLPLTNDELPSRVTSFSKLPDQIRSVLPDVVVVMMETLYKLYIDPTAGHSTRLQFRNYSNVVLMYVAQTNQRFPVQINSKLLQLQSLLN